MVKASRRSIDVVYRVFLITAIILMFSLGLDAYQRENYVVSSTSFSALQGKPIMVYPSPDENLMSINTGDPDTFFELDLGSRDISRLVLEKQQNVKLASQVNRKILKEPDTENVSESAVNTESPGNFKIPTWTKVNNPKFFKSGQTKPHNQVVFIPGIGKKSHDNSYNSNDKRAVFSLRIERKGYDDMDYIEDKRAIFISRVQKRSYGDMSNKKAIFIPRIAKRSNDDMDYVEGKGKVLIPRIGKRSLDDKDYGESKRVIFSPRIWKRSYYDTYPENKRAIFIPRIGKRNFDDMDYVESKRVAFSPEIEKRSYDDTYPEHRRENFILRIGKRIHDDMDNVEGKLSIFISKYLKKKLRTW